MEIRKKIVRRKHVIEDGKPSTKMTYLYAPISFNGTEYSGEDINQAYLFRLDECIFCDGTFAGNDRSTGKYEYIQEVVTVFVTDNAQLF